MVYTWHAKSTDYTAELLGFDGSANDTGASSYTGDYLPNLSIKAIQLHSSTLRQFMYYNDNTSHDNDLIMTIPVVNADHGGFIYHEPINQNGHTVVDPRSISKLDIYLSDEHGNVLDLLNQDILLHLEFYVRPWFANGEQRNSGFICLHFFEQCSLVGKQNETEDFSVGFYALKEISLLVYEQ